MNNETWKPVDGYEGLYEVSDKGRIFSTKRAGTRGGVLKQKRRNGYLCVDLVKDGNHRTIDVHRIVAKAFIPNPDDCPQVNHKDENKQNNIADNLEWCTCQHNITYGTSLKRAVETRERKGRPFLCEDNGVIYKSQKKFAEVMGVTTGFVNNVLHGRRKSNIFNIHFID